MDETECRTVRKLRAVCARLFYVNQPTIARGLFLLLALCVASLIGLSYYVSSNHFSAMTRSPPQPTIRCQKDGEGAAGGRVGLGGGGAGGGGGEPRIINDHTTPARLRIVSKVLVIVETPFTSMGQEIIAILEANRMRYKVELARKSLPDLTHLDKGKYGVVIFERLESYLSMDNWNRQLLDKYCRDYHVGIIAFAHPDEALINAQVKDFPLFVHSKLALRDYELNPRSALLRVTRAGEVLSGRLPGDDWTVFVANHSTYEPIAYAKMYPTAGVAGGLAPAVGGLPPGTAADGSRLGSLGDIMYVTCVLDRGELDQIQRVIFGNGFKLWLHRMLFLDALSLLSHGRLSTPLLRHILIDIDDIFVGKEGTRMTPADVQALLDSQARLQKVIEGFHFNLGFSGKYFHAGNVEENKGDDMLLEVKDSLWWFPHMWRHLQPHKFDNITLLEREMVKNRYFAQKHKLPVNSSYAVAPHHSGVYPVHEELFAAWKQVWDIQVTSTEEYPRLRPARHRRGFVHRGISVLPRQTCGLFTHTILIDEYPGGRQRLDQSIRGGELFLTILFNPVSVFMTHLSNYGNDRLALYTFESVVKFLQCWTNLTLKTVPPVQLAETYFNMFPDEVDPIWRNPCNDKRHVAIWSSSKSCSRLPHFLVIGPQKTGSTALYTFLSMHPLMVSNFNSPTTFEEVQFFNGKNYFKGLDWYMQFFPVVEDGSQVTLFEKSANYFDSEVTPERAFALLPRAKLVTILIHPARRAYSWYQHMRAHEDKVAMEFSFFEVVTADEDSPRAVRDLRHRCLNPGLYSHHLEHWLDFYKDEQLLILDGDQLKMNPVVTMAEVQQFLGFEQPLDYSTKLKFNPKKGFYCQVVNGDHTKCLGRSKGREYPAMDAQSEKYLHSFYRKHNIALSKLLATLNRPIPAWLEEELSDQR